jgi:hypothetical protein
LAPTGSPLRTAIATPADCDAAIEFNQKTLASASHWRAPAFVLDAELSFAADRIDTLRCRLGKRRLKRI